MIRKLAIFLFLVGSAFGQASGAFHATGSTVYTKAISNAPPTITSFTSLVPNVSSGGSTTLSWVVAGATGISIANTTPASSTCGSCANPSGSISTGALTTAGNFLLTATNVNGSTTATIIVGVTPLPTATLTSCTPTPQNSNALSTVTCTYSTTNAVTCAASKNPGGAIVITPCASGTFTDNPSVTTVYQVSATANGTTALSATQTVVVNQVAPSADDNTYCNTSGLSTFYNNTGSTVGTALAYQSSLDQWSELFRRCNHTALSSTPAANSGSPTVLTFTGTIATDTTTLQNAINAANCGDVIEIPAGGFSNKITLPIKRCPITNWIWVVTGGTSKGIHDPNFPAEGSLASWAQTTHTTPTGRPQFAGAALTQPMATIYANVTDSPALTTQVVTTWPALGHDTEDWSLNSTYTSGTPGPNLPALSAWRFMGIHFLASPGIRIVGPVVDLSYCDYCILDRDVVEGGDCVATNFVSTCTAGVGVAVHGTRISIINSTLFNLGCPQGVAGCTEGHGILGGLGLSWQGSIKIVNDFIEADGTNFFFGGGSLANLVNAGSPNGVQGPTGAGWNISGIGPTDVELRRNYLFKPLTWFMVKAWAGFAHAGVKNLGEFKSCDRCLMEGNLSENNWTGQYDQFGNAHLFSPKSQSSKTSAGTRVVIMTKYDDGLGGRVFAYCSNCTASGGAAGVGNFVCNEDSTQTFATCPAVRAFSGSPGAYDKTCPINEIHGACKLTVGANNYHVKAFAPATPLPAGLPTTDILELWADEIVTGYAGNTGTLPFVSVPTTYTICNRGLNPFAAVHNVTDRYDLNRHIMAGFEIQSALSDCNDQAAGIANISIHDLAMYDMDVTFWNNTISNGCCNTGWMFRLVSNAKTPTDPSIPNHISLVHNSGGLRNWNGNYSDGISIYDLSYNATTAVSNAAYMPFIKIRDNIAASSFGITAGKGLGSKFLCSTLGGCLAGPVSQGVAIYGSPTHNGLSSTWDIQRNLMIQNISTIGYNDLPDMNKGLNSVEGCGCTANNCTNSGGVGMWMIPVKTGEVDACDRIASAAGYGDIFTNYSMTFPYAASELQAGALDMTVKTQYQGFASDGSNLGADVATTLGKVAGIYAAPNLLPLTLLSTVGTLTHGVAMTTTALCSGQTTTAPYEGCGASPFKIWTITAGTVPTGLTLSLTTGVISGTPTSAGAYSFTLSAQDAARRTATQTFSGTIL